MNYLGHSIGLLVLQDRATFIYVAPFESTRPFQVLWQNFVSLAPIAAFFVLSEGTAPYLLPQDYSPFVPAGCALPPKLQHGVHLMSEKVNYCRFILSNMKDVLPSDEKNF